MTKLDPRFIGPTNRIQTLRKREQTIRVEAEDRARAMIAEELAQVRHDIVAEVRAGRQVGMSYAELKRAYGTKDHKTIVEILDGIDILKPETQYVINAPDREFDGGKIVVGIIDVTAWDDNGETLGLSFPLEYVVLKAGTDDEQIQWGTPFAEPFRDFIQSVQGDQIRSAYLEAELEKIRQAIASERAND